MRATHRVVLLADSGQDAAASLKSAKHSGSDVMAVRSLHAGCGRQRLIVAECSCIGAIIAFLTTASLFARPVFLAACSVTSKLAARLRKSLPKFGEIQQLKLQARLKERLYTSEIT